MNQQFSAWTRQTAFSLTLNEQAITEILELWIFDEDARAHGRDPADYGAQFHGRPSLIGYLLRRGMIKSNERGSYYLTEAGTLTARLLKEAGFNPPEGRGSVFAYMMNNDGLQQKPGA